MKDKCQHEETVHCDGETHEVACSKCETTLWFEPCEDAGTWGD